MFSTLVIITLYTRPQDSNPHTTIYHLACIVEDSIHNSFDILKITLIIADADRTQGEYSENNSLQKSIMKMESTMHSLTST